MDYSGFKTIVYQIIQQLDGKVNSCWQASATPNFHAAEIEFKRQKIYVLCNIEGDWAYSSYFAEDDCNLAFINFPEFSALLMQLYGYVSLTQTELDGRFVAREHMLASDIKYWRPQTLGEGLFNWWD